MLVHQFSKNTHASSNVNRVIELDVVTRFDSTVSMLESVLKIRSALEKMQDGESGASYDWPSALHISPDDFILIEHVTSVFFPVREATLALSHSKA